MKKSLIVNADYGKFSLPAGIPVLDETDKEIGITNGDGTVKITDPEIISLMESKGTDIISFAYKGEL